MQSNKECVILIKLIILIGQCQRKGPLSLSLSLSVSLSVYLLLLLHGVVFLVLFLCIDICLLNNTVEMNVHFCCSVTILSVVFFNE